MIKINSTNVTIMITDMDRSIKFYEGLGFKIKQRWENHYCMIEAPGLTIGLHPAEGKIDNGNQVSIGLMIEKADEAKVLLEKSKIDYTFHDDAGNSGIYLHFKDPDGTTIYFSQPTWDK